MSEALAELIRDNQPCVALTGAGTSTESGIPDFRSPTGIWSKLDPMDYATLGAFQRDPEKVWKEFYVPRFFMLTEAEPNPAHAALAELERRELLAAVITQNIDMLHERAGSSDVVEVHGSIRTSRCLSCGSGYPLSEVKALIEDDLGDGVPRCGRCQTALKPEVVFFDEMLPPDAMQRAFSLAESAGLMLVVGSSLEVHPVAQLPEVTLRHGGKAAVVNKTPTYLHSDAAVIESGSAGDVLTKTLGALDRVG